MIELFDTPDKDDRSPAERSAAMAAMLKKMASPEYQAAMDAAESAEQQRADAEKKLSRRKELLENPPALGSVKNLEDAEDAVSKAEESLTKAEQDIKALRGDYFGDVKRPTSEPHQNTILAAARVNLDDELPQVVRNGELNERIGAPLQNAVVLHVHVQADAFPDAPADPSEQTTPNKDKNDWTDTALKQLRQERREGATQNELAAKYNCTRQNIAKQLKRANEKFGNRKAGHFDAVTTWKAQK